MKKKTYNYFDKDNYLSLHWLMQTDVLCFVVGDCWETTVCWHIAILLNILSFNHHSLHSFFFMFFCCTDESGCSFTHTFLALVCHCTGLQLLSSRGVNVLATKGIVFYGISTMSISDKDGFKRYRHYYFCFKKIIDWQAHKQTVYHFCFC